MLSMKRRIRTEPEPELWGSVLGDFTCTYEGDSVYRLDAAEIVQTGANVVTFLRLPRVHGLRTIHIVHLNAARAENANAMAIRIDKEERSDAWNVLYDEAAFTNYDLVLPFEDQSVGSTIYRVQTNTTVNHIIVPTWTVIKK